MIELHEMMRLHLPLAAQVYERPQPAPDPDPAQKDDPDLAANDDPATVRKRLQVYHAQTKPLVDYYSQWAANGAAEAPKYRKVNGVGSVDEIRGRVMEALRT